MLAVLFFMVPYFLQVDGVLDNVSQETVYDHCAREAVESVLSGYNGTVFCYGQVGGRGMQHLATECTAGNNRSH